MAKKSWAEKLATSGEPEVKTAPKDFADIKAGQQMLITTPRQIDSFVQSIHGARPDEVTPVWRVLTPGATALKKLEGGAKRMLALREAEGLRV